MSKAGRQREADARATALLKSGFIDPDLVQLAYGLGLHNNNPALAILALELGIKAWPMRAVDGWLKLGNIYDSPIDRNDGKALQAYQAAIKATPRSAISSTMALIPLKYRDNIAIE